MVQDINIKCILCFFPPTYFSFALLKLQYSNKRMLRYSRLLLYCYDSYPMFQVKLYKSDYLTINGRNLDRASQEIDVEVEIGSESCNVTSLSRSQLTCRPPREQPQPQGDDRYPRVVVSNWGLSCNMFATLLADTGKVWMHILYAVGLGYNGK